MSDIHAAFHDSLRRQLAAGNCVAPIVDCIGKMRSEGLADNFNNAWPMSAELVGSAHKIVHISPRVVLDDAIPTDVQSEIPYNGF